MERPIRSLHVSLGAKSPQKELLCVIRTFEPAA